MRPTATRSRSGGLGAPPSLRRRVRRGIPGLDARARPRDAAAAVHRHRDGQPARRRRERTSRSRPPRPARAACVMPGRGGWTGASSRGSRFRRSWARCSARSSPTTSRSRCSTRSSPRSSSGAGSTSRCGRSRRVRARGCGSAEASALSFLIGGLGGAVGVILGTLRMPTLIRSVGMDIRRAAGTNLVVGFFLGVAGFATHAVEQGVDWGILAAGLAGAIPGGWLGARATGRARREHVEDRARGRPRRRGDRLRGTGARRLATLDQATAGQLAPSHWTSSSDVRGLAT